MFNEGLGLLTQKDSPRRMLSAMVEKFSPNFEAL